MNNHEREERRKLQERREDDDDLTKAMPNINRAHRDCERECLDQKARIKALESELNSTQEAMDAYASESFKSKDRVKSLELVLAKLGDVLYDFPRSENDAIDRICAEIDAILPATEGKKDVDDTSVVDMP